MAEIFADAETLLEFSSIAIGETLRFLDAYGSIEQANIYFDNRLRSQFWKRAELSEKQAALMEATRLIDQLNYAGDKSDDEQDKQFPRTGDSQVPVAVEQACYEVALKLLEGFDPDMEQDSLTDESQSYGGVRNTYNRTFVLDYIRAGIPSATAWGYLVPYLRDPNTFNLCRVN